MSRNSSSENKTVNLTGRWDPSAILNELIDLGLLYEENNCSILVVMCSVAPESTTQGNDVEEVLANACLSN